MSNVRLELAKAAIEEASEAERKRRIAVIKQAFADNAEMLEELAKHEMAPASTERTDEHITALGVAIRELRAERDEARKVARILYPVWDPGGDEYRWAVDTMRGWKE